MMLTSNTLSLSSSGPSNLMCLLKINQQEYMNSYLLCTNYVTCYMDNHLDPFLTWQKHITFIYMRQLLLLTA